MADLNLRYGYYNADSTGEPSYTADDFNTCTASFFTDGIVGYKSGDAITSSDLYITASSCLLSSGSLIVKGTIKKGSAVVNKHWVSVDEDSEYSLTFEGISSPATGKTYNGWYLLSEVTTDDVTTIQLKLTTDSPTSTDVVLGYLMLTTSSTMGIDKAEFDYSDRTKSTLRIPTESTATIADKVTQNEDASTITYDQPILLGDSSNTVYKASSKFTANPFTGAITASSFKGDLTGNASTATKATKDGDGNTITSTYATKSSVTALTTKTASLSDDGTTYSGTSSKVNQVEVTDNAQYEVALAGTANEICKTSNVKITPSTGKVTATTFAGDLSGNATTAETASKVTQTAVTDSASYPVLVSGGSDGAVDKVAGVTIQPSASKVIASIFKGDLVGNADTVTTTEQSDNVNYPIAMTSLDGASMLRTSEVLINPYNGGKVTAGSFVGDLNGTASKATSDANGNNIATTYAEADDVACNLIDVADKTMSSVGYLIQTYCSLTGSNNYTISFNYSGSKAGQEYALNLKNGSTNIRSYTGTIKEGKNSLVINPYSDTNIIEIWTNAVGDYSDIMLEKGTTAHSFVPYTGSTGSLNSDVAEIREDVTENTSDISVLENETACNLLNIENFYSATSNGITVKRNSDGSITISGTNGSSQTDIGIKGYWGYSGNIFNVSASKSYIFSLGVNASSYAGWSMILVNSSENLKSVSTAYPYCKFTDYIPTYLYVSVEANKTVNATIYPMLQEGSTLHDFVKYTGSTGKLNSDLADARTGHSWSNTATASSETATSLSLSVPYASQAKSCFVKFNGITKNGSNVESAFEIPIAYLIASTDNKYTSVFQYILSSSTYNYSKITWSYSNGTLTAAPYTTPTGDTSMCYPYSYTVYLTY